MKYRLCTKVQLDSFTETRRRLKGKCDNSICPQSILHAGIKNPKENKLLCGLCDENFGFLKGKYASFTVWGDVCCPCYRKLNPDELFFRLDEYIEELQEKLKKEYS